MASTEKIWAEAVRETGIWLAPYAAQVADFGRTVLPKLRERDQRISELENLIRDLLDVWNPEWEPGKGLHQRALTALEDSGE